MDNIALVVGGEDITGRVSSYEHSSEAYGGYKSASFQIAGDPLEVEDWYESGLRREVTAYNEAGEIVWNGFVNKVSITIGGVTQERGPVLNIANRVSVVYALLDTSVDPPAAGERKRTAVADDLPSQARYGILEEIYSASAVSDANALVIRDTILADNKEAETTSSLAIGGGSSPNVTCECLGWGAYLSRYIYASATAGTLSITDKIKAILAADPNGMFADVSGIGLNALAVPATEDSDRRAWEIIRGEVAKGDSAYNRWTFGIYGQRRAVYAQAPTGYKYRYSLAEMLLEHDGGEVMPWDVAPGQWVFFSDFLAGMAAPASVRLDPRALFIESVTYTAPYGLSINGCKARDLPQLLARLGLGGSA